MSAKLSGAGGGESRQQWDTIPATFRRQCATRGSAPFLVTTDRSLSWRESLDAVARTATLLENLGIGPGDYVLLACGNSCTFVVLWLALRERGAVCVPVHGQATKTAVEWIAAETGARYIIGDARADRLAAQLDFNRRQVGSWPTYEDLLPAIENLPPAEQPAATPSDVCSVLYTSGTTGVPKGAVLADRAYVAGGGQLARLLGLSESDRVLTALPLFHTNPQVYALMTTLTAGCSMALLDRFRVDSFFRDAGRLEATGFTYISTVLSRLVASAAPADVPRNLRFCVGGGAPSEVWAAIEDVYGIDVYEMYGMTETGGWVTASSRDSRRRGSCGTVREDMELAILTAEGERADAGQNGEIVVRPGRPDVLFRGYLGKDELTLRRFHDLWFHTGDLGVMDAGGYLYFHGRMDDQIKRAGENIVASEVEGALTTHWAVEEAAVVGVSDPDVGEEIKAVLVLKSPATPEELLAHCAQRLPRCAWPRLIEIRSELPKTSSQKVQHSVLSVRTPSDIDLRSEVRRLASMQEGVK